MDQKTVPVGNRMEMFVDDYLIDCKEVFYARILPFAVKLYWIRTALGR